MDTTVTGPIVFTPSDGDDSDTASWQQLADPPRVVRYGADEFIEVPTGQGVRAYVNGFPVVGDPIGLQILEPGDMVRIYECDGGSVSFIYAGRAAQAATPAADELCAFTGLPIDGLAVHCPACGCVVSEAVVIQLGQCVCGHSLSSTQQIDTPAEELL